MPSNGIAARVAARHALKPPVRSCWSKPQDDPGEEAAAAADDAPTEGPVLDAAARRVSRADHKVGLPAAKRGEKAWQGGRVMRKVGVHLDHELRSLGEGDAEAVQVGGTQALLGAAVADADPRIGRGEGVGELPGTVRGVVVHDQQRGVGQGSPDRLRHRWQVLDLVVGGKDNPRARGRLLRLSGDRGAF